MPTRLPRRRFSSDALRTHRTQRRLTQQKLASKIGVATCTICNWETGRRTPQLEVLHDLADALDCRVSDLFEAAAK